MKRASDNKLAYDWIDLKAKSMSRLLSTVSACSACDRTCEYWIRMVLSESSDCSLVTVELCYMCNELLQNKSTEASICSEYLLIAFAAPNHRINITYSYKLWMLANIIEFHIAHVNFNGQALVNFNQSNLNYVWTNNNHLCMDKFLSFYFLKVITTAQRNVLPFSGRTTVTIFHVLDLISSVF